MGEINLLVNKLSERQPISDLQVIQVTEILCLMHQLFTENTELCGALQDHLKESMGR